MTIERRQALRVNSCPSCGTRTPAAGLESVARRAIFSAAHLLGLAIGTRIAQMRESELPHNRLGARIEEQTLRIRALEEANSILTARWEKIPDRQRPHYTPELRFRILRLKGLLSLTQKEAARMFALSINTIARWDAEAESSPGGETVGSLLRPTPPVRRFADVVRHTVQAMALIGFGGNDIIARTLARAGWKISSRTVARIRREPPRLRPSPSAEAGHSVRAKYPNHVWMADLTEMPGLFRLFAWKLAIVFDVFSRMPLGWKLFRAEPAASEITSLIEKAASRHGRPRHFVSDQGSQFTAVEFRQTLARLGIRQRFGAIGKTGSISLIERFWRTLKSVSAVKLLKPLIQIDLERRVATALAFYAFHRPNQALDGATPAEIYYGLTPAYVSAIPPPRGRPGQSVAFDAPAVAFLDADRRLPILLPKVA
jgi:putative transposase